MAIFLFYRQDDVDFLDTVDSNLVEASLVYMVEAENAQDALDIFADEVTLDADDLTNYRVAPFTEGKSISRRLTVND